jgi:hypothetical protein
LRLHRGKHRAAGQEHAAQVDRHHPVPLLDRDIEPGPAREHAHERGVVDEHVDGAEGFDRSLGHRFGGCFACNVGGKTDRLQALRDQGFGHRFRRGAIDIGRDHVGAGLGELF